MTYRRRWLVLPLLALLAGCGPSIRYSLQSVPEEGGIRFARITSEGDNVLAPMIWRDRATGLRFYNVRTFDVAPDGATLAFIGHRNKQYNVFLKSTAGGVATTQRTFRESVHDVAFSPDGERIAFTDTRNGRTNVFEINARAGSAIRQLTNFEQISRSGVYAPDGNRLMFVQYEASTVGVNDSQGRQNVARVGITRYYIWQLDMDNNAFTQYAEGWAPNFSPDGKRMAITRNSRDHGNSEIWVVDLDTGTETVVASSRDQGYSQPAFSPDGRRLVFTGVTRAERNKPSNLDIFTVDADGANQTQLTFHPGHDMYPRFSPTGDSIYFMSQRGSQKGEWHIWRMEFR
jgi:Tol biopolymer transport system component